MNNAVVEIKSFEDIFDAKPLFWADAPGRVNLLGEHTDYNQGFVLPTAIPQKTRVAIRPREEGGEFHVYSAQLDIMSAFTLARPPTEHFASYIYGCIREFGVRGMLVPALDIFIDSEIPIGIGVSSSAALEIATLRALRRLLQAPLDDVQIALMGQRAEIGYAQVNVGIMDQFASSLGDTEHMLFLDTRSLEYARLPLPPNSEVLVIDSGIPRSLADSQYNARRAQCESAAQQLCVTALRDIQAVEHLEVLPEPERSRARHVVTENARVLRAVQPISPEEFGHLMNASHRSLRDDFEVSHPALDLLSDVLQRQTDVFGARLTGAGFGGACVALCRKSKSQAIAERALSEYRQAGYDGQRLVP